MTGFTFLSRLTQIAPPSTRFVFLGAGIRLGLPSHPASRRRSCLRLGVSITSSSRGLSPPSDRPCRAYSRRLRCALPRPGAAPGSALGARPAHAGPARADTRRSISSSPAHRRRDAPHASLLPWQPAARRARSAADTEAAGSWGGSLICSRLCSPPGRFPAAIGSGTHLPCHACLGRNDGYHAGPQEMDSSWVPGTVRDLQGTVTPAA